MDSGPRSLFDTRSAAYFSNKPHLPCGVSDFRLSRGQRHYDSGARIGG